MLNKINRKSDSTPRPPSHCVKDRQNNIDCGIASKPLKTVIPVVVNPLIASKNPSTKTASIPSIKGSAPIIEIAIQTTAQSNIEELRSILFVLKNLGKISPIPKDINAGIKKAVVVTRDFESISIKIKGIKIKKL